LFSAAYSQFWIMTLSSNAAHVSRHDKRLRPRRWRLEGGRIGSTDGGFSLPCTIVDMTEDGARVRVPEPLHMPARICLFDTRERFVYAADLVWSGPPEYGLKFTGKSAF
jgi:hypothetical protein